MLVWDFYSTKNYPEMYHIPVWMDMIHTQIFHIGSKSFFEPKFIPPSRSNKITKPLKYEQEISKLSQFTWDNNGDRQLNVKCRSRLILVFQGSTTFVKMCANVSQKTFSIFQSKTNHIYMTQKCLLKLNLVLYILTIETEIIIKLKLFCIN